MNKEKTYNLTVFAKFSLGRFPVVEMRLGPKGDDCVNIAGTCIHTHTHTHTKPPSFTARNGYNNKMVLVIGVVWMSSHASCRHEFSSSEIFECFQIFIRYRRSLVQLTLWISLKVGDVTITG